MYCERRQDVKFGWDQPKLPYHNPMEPGSNLTGNIADFDMFEGVIHDVLNVEENLENSLEIIVSWIKILKIYSR